MDTGRRRTKLTPARPAIASRFGGQPTRCSTSTVTNHDTERDGSTLNRKSGAPYILANLASFTWTNSDDSPPADANGFVTNTNRSWFCTDEDQGIAKMVGWYNAAAG